MPRPNPTADWTSLVVDASRLWADVGMVVALRAWRLMHGGPAAAREFERMVSEKVETGFELASALAVGRPTSPENMTREMLAVFGKRVSSNRRRLEKVRSA